ncbi:MAG: hypothetical protein ACRDLR_02520 [Gaiellaceae bacterium]
MPDTITPTVADFEALWLAVADALGVLFVDVLPERPAQLVLFPVAVSA